MKEIQTFNHPQFGLIRVCVGEHGKEWFCLSDVCKALEIGNSSQLKRRLQKRGVISNDTPTQNQYGTIVCQPMTYIDEANLYRCIFQSRKAEAERFQNWVFEEVLPQIRRTGGYASSVMMQPHEMMAMMQRPETVMVLCKTIVDLDGKVQELLPKAEYAEHVLLSPTCYTMTEVAKSLSMTVQELQHRLHDMNIIYRAPSGCWMLYAPYLKCGYESYRTKSGANLFGETIWTDTYLVWTERGKEFIHKSIKG